LNSEADRDTESLLADKMNNEADMCQKKAGKPDEGQKAR
jgi:hypothetical protein